MASPAPPISDHQARQPLSAFTDELLEEIFLRLPTPTDLARASTACASFGRIITDRSFLRRFRALYPPPLLGFIADGFHAAEAPHPSAPLARALADAADFSYSFVPDGKWSTPRYVRDVRHGRVLLECLPDYDLDYDFYDVIFLRDLELAVCDPLSRRYRLLPPVPDELTAQHERLVDFGVFLAPTGDNDEETSFRVICTAWNETKLFAFVFSSVTAQWSIAASPSWSSLGTGLPYKHHGFIYFDYARGCFYFTVPWRDKLVVLNAFKMEFSCIKNVPSGYLTWGTDQSRIVVGEDGTPVMLFLGGQNEGGSLDQLHIAKLNDELSDQWQLDNTIPLPRQYTYYTLGGAEGLLFLRGSLNDQNSVHSSVGFPNEEYFSFDVKTSELKKICGMMRHFFFNVDPYFGFPPSLSEPSI